MKSHALLYTFRLNAYVQRSISIYFKYRQLRGFVDINSTSNPRVGGFLLTRRASGDYYEAVRRPSVLQHVSWVSDYESLYSVTGAGARHCGRGAVVYVHWYQTLHACSFPPLATWHPPPTDCVHILYTVSPMSQHSSTCNFTGLSEFQHSVTRQLQWSCRHTPLRNINVSAGIFYNCVLSEWWFASLNDWTWQLF